MRIGRWMELAQDFDSLQSFNISIIGYCSSTIMWSLRWVILYSVTNCVTWYTMLNLHCIMFIIPFLDSWQRWHIFFFSPKCPRQLWGWPIQVSKGEKSLGHEGDDQMSRLKNGAVPPRLYFPAWHLQYSLCMQEKLGECPVLAVACVLLQHILWWSFKIGRGFALPSLLQFIIQSLPFTWITYRQRCC